MTRQTASAVARGLAPCQPPAAAAAPPTIGARSRSWVATNDSCVMAEHQNGGLLANITEQRMAEQMAILEKFYGHYDTQQWHAVIEMEGQVRRSLRVGPTADRLPAWRPCVASAPRHRVTHCLSGCRCSKSPGRCATTPLLCAWRAESTVRGNLRATGCLCRALPPALTAVHLPRAGYLGDALESLGQRDKADKMHEQAHIIAKEVRGDIGV